MSLRKGRRNNESNSYSTTSSNRSISTSTTRAADDIGTSGWASKERKRKFDEIYDEQQLYYCAYLLNVMSLIPVVQCR